MELGKQGHGMSLNLNRTRSTEELQERAFGKTISMKVSSRSMIEFKSLDKDLDDK